MKNLVVLPAEPHLDSKAGDRSALELQARILVKTVTSEIAKRMPLLSRRKPVTKARTRFLDVKHHDQLAVTLIHTETGAGKCVCSLLERFLRQREVAVHKIPVKGFDKPAHNFTPEFAQQEATEALAQMRERVVQHIARLRQKSPDLEIELNCTGGYKAEVAVLYELGRALRVPVYYLHETFKTCVTLP